MRPRDTLVLLTFCLSGCSGEATEQPFVVADSAGVTVVTNYRAAATIPEARLTELLVEIGTTEGDPEYQFFRVMDGLRLDDGRIAVLNAGTQQLRTYDSEGRFLSAQGREGDGPGEYRFPYRVLQLPGDSLLVYDIGLARFTVIDPTGEAARTFTPSRSMLNEPQFAGLIGDSIAVTHETIYDIPDVGFDTMYARVAFVRLDGSGTDSLMLPDARMGRIGQAGRGFVGRPFFEPAISLAADSRGLWAGSGRSPEISRYDAAGRLRRVVRWNAVPIRVTAEDVDREIENRVAESGRAGELRRWYSDTPAAESFPIYDEFQIDRQMRLWVREYERTDTADRTWLVFTPEGQLLQRVRLPSRLRVLDIDQSHLLGVRTDELDVEYVQLWRLPEIIGSK